MTKHWTVLVTASLATLLALFAPALIACADIFQWEYINPANPGQGKQVSTTLAPDGAGVSAAPGANLSYRNLTKAYLIDAELSALAVADEEGQVLYFINADLSVANLSQADLSNARLYGANLTGANLAGAEVRGAIFYDTGITTAQLYSTASYQAHDLTGINLGYLNLPVANFAGQNLASAAFRSATLVNANFNQANLTNADFSSSLIFVYESSDLTGADLSQANLTNADFSGFVTYGPGGEVTIFPGTNLTGANLSGTDARGANLYLATLTDANTSNLIQSNGHIAGLDLTAGASLVVRDYDGNPAASPPTGTLPLVVEQHLVMDATGTLRLVFDADPWDSLISFAPGIPVTLGGTLDLTFAPGVNVATQTGRTIDLFDWTGVTPTGAFTVSSPYTWNLSKLYTTGEVTLAVVPGMPGDFNNNGMVDAADYVIWRKNFGTQASYDIWRAHFGETLGGGASTSANAPVPEPASLVLLLLGMLGMCTYRRTAVS